MTKWILCGLIIITSATAEAHGGGVDPEGCHLDAETGMTHCHAEPVPDNRKVIVPDRMKGPLCDTTCWTVAILSAGFMASVIVWAWYPTWTADRQGAPSAPTPSVQVFINAGGSGFTITW